MKQISYALFVMLTLVAFAQAQHHRGFRHGHGHNHVRNFHVGGHGYGVHAFSYAQPQAILVAPYVAPYPVAPAVPSAEAARLTAELEQLRLQLQAYTAPQPITSQPVYTVPYSQPVYTQPQPILTQPVLQQPQAVYVVPGTTALPVQVEHQYRHQHQNVRVQKVIVPAHRPAAAVQVEKVIVPAPATGTEKVKVNVKGPFRSRTIEREGPARK